ncbi:3-hydroxyacyl-CoA dehydrogenase family protein [Candidatus Bathyarchaeota archaeon]|nr:3-hydroxyacyl-CoA dehydrogenase family protein [Candidatus Bathyarchaeota archaeon]
MKVDKVACVGAGLIGRGWATLFAWRGYRVTLQDLKDEILENASFQIRRNLEFLAKKGLLKDESWKDCFRRIDFTTDIEDAVSEADYVQESVYEDYKVKKEVFRLMDAAAPPHAILASSSSTLKMSVIQEATEKPERCVIVHPWNPPHLMPLVEIVPGEKTSPETLRKTRSFMIKLGKVTVVQKKETVGTIGNRLAAALWREAIDLVYRGIAEVEDIDKAVSASLGIRWAVLGPYLSYHLGGGKGGIEYYLRHLGPAMENRWRTLATWTSIPSSAERKIIQGVKNMSLVKGKSMDEISEWRDEKIVELLKILYLE